MSLYIALVIMLAAGILGGIINYCLTAAGAADAPKPNFIKSVVIGIGATFLIPLFLQIAQSKLLDGIRNSGDLTMTAANTRESGTTKLADKKGPSHSDTTKTDTAAKKGDNTDKGAATKEEVPPLKDYLVFTAYCLLAAAAGPRFINSVMDGVLKDKKISQLTKENTKVTQEKDKIEQVQALQTARNALLADHDETAALASAEVGPALAAVVKPQIGPKTVPNDPQKGRFGGRREVNGRKLCASVDPLRVPLLYKVVIWVESTDPAKPLTGDVIFYLHDTFRPSVITLPENEYTGGKAKLEPKTAWGAFTVGAVVDGGLTLLEYDLSLDTEFDENFRSR